LIFAKSKVRSRNQSLIFILIFLIIFDFLIKKYCVAKSKQQNQKKLRC